MHSNALVSYSLLHLGHTLILVIYFPSQSISLPHLMQTIGLDSLLWNIISVPQSGLPQRYVRLPKDCSNPLTMASNTLIRWLSVSGDTLLVGLKLGNFESLFASLLAFKLLTLFIRYLYNLVLENIITESM